MFNGTEVSEKQHTAVRTCPFCSSENVRRIRREGFYKNLSNSKAYKCGHCWVKYVKITVFGKTIYKKLRKRYY